MKTRTALLTAAISFLAGAAAAAGVWETGGYTKIRVIYSADGSGL